MLPFFILFTTSLIATIVRTVQQLKLFFVERPKNYNLHTYQFYIAAHSCEYITENMKHNFYYGLIVQKL